MGSDYSPGGSCEFYIAVAEGPINPPKFLRRMWAVIRFALQQSVLSHDRKQCSLALNTAAGEPIEMTRHYRMLTLLNQTSTT